MKKFHTDRGDRNKPIQIFECERETDVNVWIDGRQYKKRSTWHGFHDTFEEAKNFLLQDAAAKVLRAAVSLDAAKVYLEFIKGLKE